MCRGETTLLKGLDVVKGVRAHCRHHSSHYSSEDVGRLFDTSRFIVVIVEEGNLVILSLFDLLRHIMIVVVLSLGNIFGYMHYGPLDPAENNFSVHEGIQSPLHALEAVLPQVPRE